MARMKTFTKYLILFLLLYVFVSFMAYWYMRSTLVPIQDYKIEFENPNIKIEEAKASRVNGYVKGIIKNDTNEKITNKYIKIDFISGQGNVILSKYIDIANLESGEQQDFNIQFNAENIKSFKLYFTDEKPINDIKINKTEIASVLGGVFLAWLIFK